MDRTGLRERAIKRGLATWKDFGAGSGEHLPSEGTVNRLGRDTIRQAMAAADEEAAFEAAARDRLLELEMLELEHEQQKALNRYLAEKKALAYRVAGERLLLAAREYAVQVDALVMEARKYAALIDREGIELQKRRALMDLRKAEAQLEELDARLLLEILERRNQEIALARAKVEVAQANVRAVLAEVQAQEAEVRVIRAQLEVLRAEAEKADLIADVAQIMADIVVRGLARIRLAVETAEVDAAFGFVEQRLQDVLATLDVRRSTEELRAAYEELIKAEVAYQEEAQKAQTDLEKLRMAMLERLQDFEQEKQRLADHCAKVLKDVEQQHREALAQVKTNAEIALHTVNQWAEALLTQARVAADKYRETAYYHVRHYSQKIIKGFYSTAGPVRTGSGEEGMTGPPPQTAIPDISVSGQRCNYEEPYL